MKPKIFKSRSEKTIDIETVMYVNMAVNKYEQLFVLELRHCDLIYYCKKRGSVKFYIDMCYFDPLPRIIIFIVLSRM